MKAKIKWLGLLVLVLAVGVISLNTSTPATAQQAKVYKMAIFEDITTTNTLSIYGPNATVWNSYARLGLGVHGGLFGLSDKTYQIVPGLAVADNDADFAKAQAFTKRSDGKFEATITIRKGYKWSDGTDVTADDVAFSYNGPLSLDPVKMGGSWVSNVDPDFLEKVEVVNPNAVKFIMKEVPGLARWQFGMMLAPIFQKKYWEPKFTAAKGSQDATRTLYANVADDEPAAGGFKLAQVNKGAFVAHTARPCKDLLGCGAKVEVYSTGYVEVKEGVYRIELGKKDKLEASFTAGPKIDGTVHNIFGDQNAAVLGLTKGDVDFILNPLGVAAGFRQQLASTPGVATVSNPSNGLFYMSFNMRRAPFNEKGFRQAVQLMVDKEFVCGQLLNGLCNPAYTVVPLPLGAWVAPEFKNDAFLAGLGKGKTEGVRAQEAIKLLKAAGFSWDAEPQADAQRVTTAGKGLKHKGQPVKEIELLCPHTGYDPFRATFCQHIESRLQKLGIPIRANLTGFNIIVTRVFTDQKFDMWVLGWGLTIFPDYLRDFFHSDNTGLDGNNPQGFSNKDFDKLADEFVAATDLAKAQAIAFQLEKILADETPYVPLFNAPLFEAYRSDRVKFPYTEVLDGLQNFSGMPSTIELLK
jgi:ABC-type transport system substrate-binding protein